jgi:hypothetical protein
MARLVAPNKAIKEVGFRTEKRNGVLKGNDGIYNVNDPKVIARMKAEGFTESYAVGGADFAKTGECHPNTYILTRNCGKCGTKSRACGTCKEILSPCECE